MSVRGWPVADGDLGRMGGEPTRFVIGADRVAVRPGGRYAVVVWDGPGGTGRDLVALERVREHLDAVGAAEHSVPLVVAGEDLVGTALLDPETGREIVLEALPDGAGAARVRMAVLVSGGGTTLRNFLDRIAAGSLRAEVCLVISSSEGAYALERARDAGLRAAVVEWRGEEHEQAFHDEITARVEDAAADLVVMAGFLRLWRFPDRWYGRVLNIHPGLLPAFGGKGMYGRHVHAAVLASGAEESGCTVHFADHQYDQGPIVLQRTVPVLPDDTPAALAARVFEAECEAYPGAINLFAGGRLRLDGDEVVVLPE